MRRFLVLLIVLVTVFACKPRRINIEDIIAELEYDKFQTIVLEILNERHNFAAIPFITYVMMGMDHDRFYERYFLWALLDDIDSNLSIHHSISHPYAFTFDRETGELVRYFYPDGTFFEIGEIQDNFPERIIRQFLHISQEEHINRVDSMRETNIWNAKVHFGLEIGAGGW